MSNKAFKFNEPEYMSELTEFITKTYDRHTGAGGEQSFEAFIASGVAEQVALSHIRSLALKTNPSRQDLFELNHYTMLLSNGYHPDKTTLLTQARLMELLTYNKRTGLFRWRKNRGSAKKGQIAGFISEDGYRHIKIDDVDQRSARLAYLYVYGHFPTGDRRFVDHINHKRAVDRISNLRAVTAEENNLNRRINKRGS